MSPLKKQRIKTPPLRSLNHSNGNLVVFGGTISSNGNLNGDVVIFGGQISLDKYAVVTGDVVTIGGQLTQADGAEIKGEVVKNVSPEIQIPNGRIPLDVTPPQINIDYNPFWTVAGIFYRALIVAALAMLVVIFLKPQMENVSHAIVSQPVMAGGVGLLTVFGGPISIVVVALVMVITLILIPVAALVVFLGALAIALAWSRRRCGPAPRTCTSSRWRSASACATGWTASASRRSPCRRTSRAPSSPASRSWRRWTSPRGGSRRTGASRSTCSAARSTCACRRCPATHGESIVMRILDKEVALVSLENLGFHAEDHERFRRIIKRPNGIFLVTAPTGSGKTTTLYAALKKLNRPDVKIITAEHPVEYNLEGIKQAEVAHDIGRTFSVILKAMLRQAPNALQTLGK